MSKTVAILLFLTTSALAVSGCDGSEEEEADGNEPNEFCDVNFCADSNVLRNLCVVAFDTCIAEPDTNDDDCRVAALFICATDVSG